MLDLSTPTARSNLPPSKNKRWVRLGRGRAIGYRRPDGNAGSWYARRHVGGGAYRMAVLGTADDIHGADGSAILNFAHALTKATVWEPDQVTGLPAGPVTVAYAVTHYLEWFKQHRRSYNRVKARADYSILPKLGPLRVDALTPLLLRRWHEGLAEQPARLRGGQTREATTPEQKRARKVTANRALTTLKAVLNRAVEDGLVEGPGVWTKVKPFTGVESSRARFLEEGELKRLLRVCDPDFRDLVATAVHSGARYGELAALRVGDYLPEAQAVHFATTKSGKPRNVFLSEEGSRFLDRLTAGRGANDVLLARHDGSPWGRNHQARRMREACKQAGIDPPAGFHQLRHSYASLYLQSGGSLIALSKQLGHSDTRMVEKHYAHLADRWRAAEARAHAPKLGTGPEKITRIGRRR